VCLCVGPVIEGQCQLVSSTERSLAFTWASAQSAVRYELVGHTLAMSSSTNSISVDDLDPGYFYTFSVRAVSSQGLASDNITCADSTGLYAAIARSLMTRFQLYTPAARHITCIFTILFRTGSSIVVNVCQVRFGFLPAEVYCV